MLDDVPVSGIRRFSTLAANTPGCINLSLGEPEFDTPECIKKAACDSLARGNTHYPPNVGFADLRRCIARYEKENGRVYSEDEIIFTLGATEALFTALCGILDPGDEVIIPVPAFGLYEQIVKFCRAKCVFYDTTADGFQLDSEKLRALISPRTKAIIINSPNNPTGAVYSTGSLEAVNAAVADKPVFIVTDEVYGRLSYCGKIPRITDFEALRKQTLAICSFSKPYAMTGWRAGWLTGDIEVISQIKKIHQLTVVSGVSFVMDACKTALETDVSDTVSMYRSRRDRVCEKLSEMGLEFVMPQGAFYVFPSIEKFGIPSEQFCLRLIKEAGLCLVPGSCFGSEGHVRISYCCPEKSVFDGLDRLAGFINSLK